MTSTNDKTQIPVWRQPDGAPLSCREKIKVLNENLLEIREMAQDALEDAILMGCDEDQVRAVMAGLIAGLENPYADRGKAATAGDGGEPGVKDKQANAGKSE